MHTPRSAKTILLAGLLAGLSALPAGADFGKSGWVIFKKNQTASFRSLAAVSPAPDNLAGTLYNPALLGSLNQTQALTTGELGASEDKLGGLMLGTPWKNSAWAAGLLYFDAGTMELNWLEGTQVQTETVAAQRDFLGFVSYGYALGENLWSGLTLEFARSELAQRRSALAVAADAGLLYQPLPGWTLSLAVNHVGGSTAFVDEQAPLPSTVYLGTGYGHSARDWRFLLGAGVQYNWVDEKSLPEAGLEFGYSLLSFNAGYRLGVDEGKLHFGVGLDWQNFLVQYAYEPGTYLDAAHRLSLGYRFGAAGPRETAAAPSPARRAQAPSQSPEPATTTGATPQASQPAQALPPLATQVRAKKSGVKFVLTWEAPRGAAGFNVYLKTGSGTYVRQNPAVLKTARFTTKALAKHKTYFIVIKTVDAQGRENNGTEPKEIK